MINALFAEPLLLKTENLLQSKMIYLFTSNSKFLNNGTIYQHVHLRVKIDNRFLGFQTKEESIVVGQG